MLKSKSLVIIGDGETAQIAYEYFTHDSPYEVVAFSVEKAFLKRESLYDLPILPLESLTEAYPPSDYHAYVAISYTKLNRVRSRLFKQVKAMGYQLATYVSSHAFVWHNASIGENSFIFENNVIQHQVTIGSNVILWSGNHIGHQTIIHDHCYLSSHVVVSGFCEIGSHSFLGVNCSINDTVKIAEDCVIGSGAVVIRSTEAGRVYVGNPARPLDKTSYDSFGVDNP